MDRPPAISAYYRRSENHRVSRSTTRSTLTESGGELYQQSPTEERLYLQTSSKGVKIRFVFTNVIYSYLRLLLPFGWQRPYRSVTDSQREMVHATDGNRERSSSTFPRSLSEVGYWRNQSGTRHDSPGIQLDVSDLCPFTCSMNTPAFKQPFSQGRINEGSSPSPESFRQCLLGDF